MPEIPPSSVTALAACPSSARIVSARFRQTCRSHQGDRIAPTAFLQPAGIARHRAMRRKQAGRPPVPKPAAGCDTSFLSHLKKELLRMPKLAV
jgi:hypothetical protein